MGKNNLWKCSESYLNKSRRTFHSHWNFQWTCKFKINKSRYKSRQKQMNKYLSIFIYFYVLYHITYCYIHFDTLFFSTHWLNSLITMSSPGAPVKSSVPTMGAKKGSPILKSWPEAQRSPGATGMETSNNGAEHGPFHHIYPLVN